MNYFRPNWSKKSEKKGRKLHFSKHFCSYNFEIFSGRELSFFMPLIFATYIEMLTKYMLSRKTNSEISRLIN